MTNHPLRSWRIANDLTAAAFGATVGITKYAVCDYERRRRFPGPAVLSAIEHVTGGAISASVMLAAYQTPDVSPGKDQTPVFPAGPPGSAGAPPPIGGVEK